MQLTIFAKQHYVRNIDQLLTRPLWRRIWRSSRNCVGYKRLLL